MAAQGNLENLLADKCDLCPRPDERSAMELPFTIPTV